MDSVRSPLTPSVFSCMRRRVPEHQGDGWALPMLVQSGNLSLGIWSLGECRPIGIHLGTGIAAAVVAATIGAILLLIVLRLFHTRG
jgi:hypothetical protein